MADFLPQFEAKVMMGVGAAFDLHTGRMTDAPRWMKNAGLQWFHRLCQEPGRLWRRYFRIVPGFMICILLQMLHLVKYGSDNDA